MTDKENEKTAECKHEWEEIRGSTSTAKTNDGLTMIPYTNYKCKLCGETKSEMGQVIDYS